MAPRVPWPCLLAALAALLLPAGAPALPAPGELALLPEAPGPCAGSGTPAGLPEAFTCLRFRVACAGVSEPLAGDLALASPLGPPRATALFHGGGEGTNFWSGSHPAAHAFLQELRAAGFATAQVRWDAAWTFPPEGEAAGLAGTSCRGAAVVRWVHDHVHAPLAAAEGAAGVCGFCVVGWSNGANHMAYGLTHHGLGDRLDALILEAGPPRADHVKGCLRRPGEEPWWFDATRVHGTDFAFGIRTLQGPCARADASWEPRWRADSLATGGTSHHPRTRVHFVFGSADDGPGPVHGALYAQRLRDAGHLLLREVVVPGAPHNLMATPEGVQAMREALLRTAP